MSKILEGLDNFIALCKSIDPTCTQRNGVFLNRFEFKIHGVTEADLEAVEAKYGDKDEKPQYTVYLTCKVQRHVSLHIGEAGCPTVTPIISGYIGSIKVELFSVARKATKEEVEKEFNKIRQKVENCCPPPDGAGNYQI